MGEEKLGLVDCGMVGAFVCMAVGGEGMNWTVYYSSKSGKVLWHPVSLCEMNKKEARLVAQALLKIWPDKRWAIGIWDDDGIEEVKG